MTNSNQFKLILRNMEKENLLNFIWVYNQYVQNLEDDEYPVPIENFYYTFYKSQLI